MLLALLLFLPLQFQLCLFPLLLSLLLLLLGQLCLHVGRAEMPVKSARDPLGMNTYSFLLLQSLSLELLKAGGS